MKKDRFISEFKLKFKLITCVVLFSSISLSQYRLNLDWKYHDVNLLKLLITNMGVFDTRPVDGISRINCEFPVGSGIELIGGGMGLWVGALKKNNSGKFDTLVTQAYSKNRIGPTYEFYPADNQVDHIYSSSIDQILVGEGVRFVDDDGDGRIDEDELDGYDNDGDGKIDEDYGTISQQDYICIYYDYHNIDQERLWGQKHVPIGLKVIQKSYAWSYRKTEQFIFIEYRIINDIKNYNLILNKNPSGDTLINVYIGFWIDADIGYKGSASGFDDYSYWLESEMMTVSADAPGGNDGTMPDDEQLGVCIIEVPEKKLKFSWHAYESATAEPQNDIERYRAMSDGIIDLPQSPELPVDTRVLMAFGPFTLVPEDTIKFIIAVIGGFGKDDLIEKARFARKLYENNFIIPQPPPPPKIKLKALDKAVKIDWHWYPEYSGINPEEFIDRTRKDGIRKDFAGYRLYRSENPEGPWTLIAEFDKVGDGFGNETGLQYEYIDSGLINGKRYFYAVTAFDLPEITPGGVIPSQESSPRLSKKMIIPGKVASSVGEVYVVPNPYRGDVDYTRIGWEYPTQPGRKEWFPVDRQLHFVNLPPYCVIKIYTLTGELVKTIEHRDPNSGTAIWNLISDSGQTIASGLYLFTVEEIPSGKVQVGKFVVIK